MSPRSQLETLGLQQLYRLSAALTGAMAMPPGGTE